MDSQRFFIALVPPPEIQASVNQIKHYFKEHYDSSKALNSPPHITLQAPFNWPNGQDLEELTAGLQEFSQSKGKVAIALRNFGAFPPKVIYVDVVHTPGLMTLQRELSAFMKARYGFTDRRYSNFCPHMTVAFRDLKKAAFLQAWPEFKQKTLEFDFMAQALTLLRHNGQNWQIHQSYPLNKTARS